MKWYERDGVSFSLLKQCVLCPTPEVPMHRNSGRFAWAPASHYQAPVMSRSVMPYQGFTDPTPMYRRDWRTAQRYSCTMQSRFIPSLHCGFLYSLGFITWTRIPRIPRQPTPRRKPRRYLLAAGIILRTIRGFVVQGKISKQPSLSQHTFEVFGGPRI